MPWSFFASLSASKRRWLALLRTILVSGVLAGSLSACVPLVVGSVVGGGLWLATDRRTSGAQIDDEAIEIRGNSRIKTALQNRGRVNVTSYNRIVLLTGQVATQADHSLAEGIAKTLPNVRYIVNEVAIGPVITASTPDVLTSTRVRTVLLGTKNVNSKAIKVTTENGVVYLMGIVTQQESNRAAEIASGVSGVRKVVKVFEIVSDAALAPVQTTETAPTATHTTTP